MTHWDESGRVWEEDHGLLDEEQVAKCERADVAEPLRSPVPTRMISNGEYMPARKRISKGGSRRASKSSPTKQARGSATAAGRFSEVRGAWRPPSSR